MEQTSATMLEAMTVTSLSSRICALVCSAMISRRRRNKRRGPPPADISSIPLNRENYGSGSVQLIGRMKGADGQFDIFLGDQDADFDLGCRDHLDVDALVGKRTEHGRGNAGMRTHTDADD